MEKTTVYFIGGPRAGTSTEMEEPLLSVYPFSEAVDRDHRCWNCGNCAGDAPPPKEHLYILHTIGGTGGTAKRCYVHSDLQLGGMTEADFQHVPK